MKGVRNGNLLATEIFCGTRGAQLRDGVRRARHNRLARRVVIGNKERLAERLDERLHFLRHAGQAGICGCRSILFICFGDAAGG